jgi:hypothetical protein
MSGAWRDERREGPAMSGSAVWEPDGLPLRLDPEAESADPALPAFLARPEGAPVYHGFPLLEESRTADGWCFGAISDPDDSEGSDWGDAFLVAPDGTRAGIVWEAGTGVLEVSIPPEEDRWGVYKLYFGSPAVDRRGLVERLREWLPELRRLHREWRAGRGDHSPLDP